MCVFCEIVKGNIPSYKIYEDDKCLAFLDISQAGKGHTLVVPKEHFANILEIPEDLMAYLTKIVRKITIRYSEVLGTKDFNILNNCGPIAGQTVNHFHIHIIPRYENDDLEIKFTEHKEDFEKLVNLLKIN